ncbi:MAG: YbaB/EbfC family nucleoid-associated protein [Clostridia bacterium]|nr:YbaB/EbfC family nucleoid-associated protein [Clostridia bacterium]
MDQNFGNLFDQALKLRERIDELKMELASKKLQVTAGDGEIILVMNGLQEVLDVTVNMEGIPELQKNRLETLLKRAINQGIAKTRDVAGQEVFFTFSPSSE